MAGQGVKALGAKIRAGNDNAPSLELDAEVRGFTGLLVGLMIGLVTWGLAFMIWWLV